MMLANRSSRSRSRSLRPVMVSLEERVLLNAAMFHPLHDRSVSAQVQVEVQQNHKSKGPTVKPINKVSAGGYVFTNFDGPNAGTNAAAGTNQNGISNSGTSVGFSIENNGELPQLHRQSPEVQFRHASEHQRIDDRHGLGGQRLGHGGGHRWEWECVHPLKRQGEDVHPPWRYVRDRFRDQRQGNNRRSVRHFDRDAGVHQGQSQDLHHDQCPFGSEHRERPVHQ